MYATEVTGPFVTDIFSNSGTSGYIGMYIKIIFLDSTDNAKNTFLQIMCYTQIHLSNLPNTVPIL